MSSNFDVVSGRRIKAADSVGSFQWWNIISYHGIVSLDISPVLYDQVEDRASSISKSI